MAILSDGPRRRATAHAVAIVERRTERSDDSRSLGRGQALYRFIAAAAILGTILNAGLAIACLLDWK